MDYRLERIREFATANLFSKSEIDDFCQRLQGNDLREIVQADDRVRIDKTLYRLVDGKAAQRMADLLVDYVGANGLPVRISHECD